MLSIILNCESIGMRMMVQSLITSLPHLFNVVLLFAFLLFVFGIIGMQFFGGALRQRCFDIETGKQAEFIRLCSSNDFGLKCSDTQFCADSGYNPNFGVTSFDNILISWLTILTSISLEGWVDVMYMVRISISISIPISIPIPSILARALPHHHHHMTLRSH